MESSGGKERLIPLQIAMIKTRDKEELNTRLARLNNDLREKILDTHSITIEEWNKRVAPSLSEISMIIDEVRLTARTFRLPDNYFEE